ncbi:MAG: diguanylate cyclase [Chloroflexi bacterium]|nr:diguanylate cyclase [Chloroflexota bacterium]
MTNLHLGPYPIALLVSGIISFILFIILLRTRKEAMTWYLAIALLAEAEWTIMVGLGNVVVDPSLKILFAKISYWGIYNCVPLFLLFTIHYVGKAGWLNRWKIALMWVVPVIMIVLAGTNDYHHLIWTHFAPSPRVGDNVLIYFRGPFYYLGVVNNYAMMLAIFLLLFWRVLNSRHTIYQRQSLMMLISVLPPWIWNIIYVFEWEPIRGMDFTSLGFSISGFLIFMSIYYYRLLDLSPVARDALFERIKDAILILDKENRLVDVNAAGEKLLGFDRKQLIGQPAGKFLDLLPALACSLSNGQDFHIEITLSDLNHRVLDVTCTRLLSPNKENVGRLITLQDVTSLKRAEYTEREGRILAEALRDVALAVTSTLDISEVLDRLLENVYRVLPCSMTNIVLVDDEGIGRVAHFRGYKDPAVIDWLKNITFDIDKVESYQFMDKTGQALIVPDTHAVDYWKIRDNQLRSYLGAPIWVKGRAVGFINLDHEQVGFYNAEHAERLQAFANLAAIALDNARLFIKVNELATHDGLTGLNNRRHLFYLAANEVQRALRYQTPLSLLIIDIDHFKQVNDTFGHQVGDVTLQKVAQVFQTMVRDIDISGRYGGDEFCLLMPETNASFALKAAERILELVNDIEINTDQGIQHITASIGVATLGEHDISFDELLQHADEALYSAKQNGRCQIREWIGLNTVTHELGATKQEVGLKSGI